MSDKFWAPFSICPQNKNLFIFVMYLCSVKNFRFIQNLTTDTNTAFRKGLKKECNSLFSPISIHSSTLIASFNICTSYSRERFITKHTCVSSSVELCKRKYTCISYCRKLLRTKNTCVLSSC